MPSTCNSKHLVNKLFSVCVLSHYVLSSSPSNLSCAGPCFPREYSLRVSKQTLAAHHQVQGSGLRTLDLSRGFSSVTRRWGLPQARGQESKWVPPKATLALSSKSWQALITGPLSPQRAQGSAAGLPSYTAFQGSSRGPSPFAHVAGSQPIVLFHSQAEGREDLLPVPAKS